MRSKRKKIKIVRNESIGSFSWNESGANDWANSSLKVLLNDDYYNKKGIFSSNGLKKEARTLISNSTWYLGAHYTSLLSALRYYNIERSNTIADTEGSLEKIKTNIGLIYPSDFLYIYDKNINPVCLNDSHECNEANASKGWIFNVINNEISWSIMPLNGWSIT